MIYPTGHVSTIIGQSRISSSLKSTLSLRCDRIRCQRHSWRYRNAPETDIEGKASVEVEYKTVVKEEGNPKAVKFIEDVFEPQTVIGAA